MQIGKPATVEFTGDRNQEASRVTLTVTRVRTGSAKDLSEFPLGAAAKQSRVYYVDTKLTNVGSGDLSGEELTLFGKVSEDLVVPPVVFGSPFPPCSYHAFPKGFTKNKSTDVCVVLFAPNRGTVSEVQWRAADTEPIAWVVR